MSFSKQLKKNLKKVAGIAAGVLGTVIGIPPTVTAALTGLSVKKSSGSTSQAIGQAAEAFIAGEITSAISKPSTAVTQNPVTGQTSEPIKAGYVPISSKNTSVGPSFKPSGSMITLLLAIVLLILFLIYKPWKHFKLAAA